MTYRKNVTYRCNVRRYVARSKIYPVRPARPVLPVGRFIKSYNGELRNALDYARFVNGFVKWERENESSRGI